MEFFMSINTKNEVQDISLYEILMDGYSRGDTENNVLYNTSTDGATVVSVFNANIAKTPMLNNKQQPYKFIPVTATLLSYSENIHKDDTGKNAAVSELVNGNIVDFMNKEDEDRKPTHSLSEGYQVFDPVTKQIQTFPYAPN